jgi:UDP-glucuronate 4-epimerase
LKNEYWVTVVDNYDSFYPKETKQKNLSAVINHPNLIFHELDIVDTNAIDLHLTDTYDAIIHLAAKAGVRPSIENPIAYQQTNVAGTQNLLEFARKKSIQQFVFASSSSVYGINKNIPWVESDGLLNPISPYASTKISGELLGHVYSHLYNIRFIGLRFFTVFGPRQRPDLAIHAFSKKILNNETIPFFGDGNTQRDYTFIDDIVKGIIGALNYDKTNYEIINLGNSHAVSLAELVNTLETVLEKKAIINKLPEQPGDVPVTFSDISKAKDLINYMPTTSLKDGVIRFKEWLASQ